MVTTATTVTARCVKSKTVMVWFRRARAYLLSSSPSPSPSLSYCSRLVDVISIAAFQLATCDRQAHLTNRCEPRLQAAACAQDTRTHTLANPRLSTVYCFLATACQLLPGDCHCVPRITLPWLSQLTQQTVTAWRVDDCQPSDCHESTCLTPVIATWLCHPSQLLSP